MDVDLVGSLAEAVPSDPLLAQLRSTSLFEVNPYCVDTAHHANLRGMRYIDLLDAGRLPTIWCGLTPNAVRMSSPGPRCSARSRRTNTPYC